MIRAALLSRRFVEDLRERLDFAPVVNLRRIEFVLQFFQLRRVRALLQTRRVVVGLEGFVDGLGIVDEIQDERVFLPRNLPVKPRQGLHRLHSVEPLVHIHGAQQRLVEAGLVFVRHEQHLVVRRGEPLGQLPFTDRLPAHAIRVHPRLGEL